MRRLPNAVTAGLFCVTLLLGPAAPVAEAKTPPPPSALAAPTIDAHLGYMRQSTCTPTAKPGTTALLKALIKTWGGSSSGISRHCSVGATSEHKEGRALDWRMNVKSASQRKRVDQAMAWLTANNGEAAYRLGVMYIIWNQRIWSLYYPELGWRKMADRGSVTSNHKNHVHISLSWDGAMKQTSWWTGTPVAEPLNSRCGVSAAPACLPTVGRGRAWPLGETVVPASFLPAPWTEPALGGSPQVGRTLTAVPGTWVPADAALTYQWRAGSRDIPGAVAATYVVGAETVGTGISVRVTATTAEATTTRTTDGTTDVIKGRFTSAPTPKLVGTTSTDQMVTADAGTWAPAPDTTTYAWKRNGKAIRGATAPMYAITASDTGKKLSVTVTARTLGYDTTSVTSSWARVATARFSAVGASTITGQPIVGGTLTAVAGEWAPLPSGLRYQWYAGTKKIRKATKANFRPTASQVGKQLRVRIRASRPGYLTTSSYSEWLTVTVPTGG